MIQTNILELSLYYKYLKQNKMLFDTKKKFFNKN